MNVPLVTIFIPTYNRKHLLIPCLESALAQTVTDIEVVVVDNASTDGAWEVCQEFARRDSRVRIFRNETNVGPGFNGLRCITEARGYYGKALFSDDLISPDFLEKTLPLIANPQVGLVFTAAEIGSEPGEGAIHYKVGDNPGTMPSQEFIHYSMFRQGQLVPNSPAAALFRLADIRQNVLMYIPSPAMHDYHEHGMGVDLIQYLITAHKYPLVAYVPEALAFFRSHEDSETTASILKRPEKWMFGYQQAKIWFASRYNYPILLQCLLTQEWVREAYNSGNWVPFNEIASRFLHHPPNLPVANNSDNQFIADFRHARQHLADFWLNTPPHLLESICSYSGFLIQIHQILVKNDSKNEPLNESEQVYANELVAQVAKGFDQPKAINYFLAAMLYYDPQQLSLQYQSDFVPDWFAGDYVKFLLSSPSYFQHIEETDKFYHYMQNLVESISIDIFNNKNAQLRHNIASSFCVTNNFLPLYFNEQNLNNIYSQRGNIIEFALKSADQQVEYIFRERPTDRQKIRLGILATDFNPQKQTFTTIPIFEYLDRDQFEIILYALNVTDHPLEQYCQSRADLLVKLPTDDQALSRQVETIREDDLDILLISTNVTTITNPITLLAQHRLARVQVTYGCSPVTTGIPNIDYYIASKFVEPGHDAQQQYREQLITVDGVSGCFSFVLEPDAPTLKIDRESIGVSENSTVFVSGANFYKIIPELRETWAKIMASVPNSALVLYPFNPDWSSDYPTTTFINSMNAIFAKYGVDKSRLVILDIQGRSNVKECLKLGDVYLDSYPYGGYASLLDSLEVGLPSIVRKGNSLRSRRGAELLQELDVNDLITDSEESYIKLAVELGTNAELRQRHGDQIKQKMDGTPKFLDSRAYSAKMGYLFKELFLKHLGNEIGNDLNLRDVNLIIFPDWGRSDDSLYEDLGRVISAIATHPDKNYMTLLIDIGNISEEDANLILSSVAMNLLMEEELDITEGSEISLVGKLSDIQWSALLPRIQARIILENENKQAIYNVKAENLLSCDLSNLDESLKSLVQVLPIQIAIAEEQFNRGIALQKEGNFSEAIISYQQALDIKPDFQQAQHQLLVARYQQEVVAKGYQFTQDWFSWNIPVWQHYLKKFIAQPNIKLLEIGSWEGRSSCWLLDNVLTHPSSRITCIDTFEGSFEHTEVFKFADTYLQSLEARFDFNINQASASERVHKLIGKSNEILRTLPLNTYDIAYIDGSHIASDVLEDAVLVWKLVKIGGLIIFDDYPFSFSEKPLWNTSVAVDAFLTIFSDKLQLTHKAYQVIIEKTQD